MFKCFVERLYVYCFLFWILLDLDLLFHPVLNYMNESIYRCVSLSKVTTNLATLQCKVTSDMIDVVGHVMDLVEHHGERDLKIIGR